MRSVGAGSGAVQLSPRAASRVLLLLTATSWVSAGFLSPILVLRYLERGLSISEALTLASVTGLVVCALELPTSGFADSFGRRPVYLAAAIIRVLALLVLALAGSWAIFAVASVLTGTYRALDSGPLEAWYVDTVHASEPGADVDRGLARQGAVMGMAIGGGALICGLLVAAHPVPARSALELPILVAAALAAVHVLAVLVLMREVRSQGPSWAAAADGVRQTPATVRSGLSLLVRGRVLRSLVLVELFWVLAMVVFESFQPIRLAELAGGEDAAAALMGPVVAGGWAVFALGSALAGRTSSRLGVTRTAMLGRVLNGLGAVIMGLALDPAQLIAAFFLTYAMHGFAGPMHSALLHREASSANRATVLSINSMVFFAAFGAAAPLLGLLAQARSTPFAMVVAGAVSTLGVLLYLPALRAERERDARVTTVPASGQ